MAHAAGGRGWRERPRPGGRWDRRWGLALCLSLLGGVAGWPAEPSDEPPRARSCGDAAWLTAPVAEVTFGGPRAFVILVGPRNTEHLYQTGDSIPGANDAGAGVSILRIDPGRVQVRSDRNATAIWLTPNDPLPGLRGRIVARTTILGGLDYHYGAVEHSPDAEPRLRCVRAGRAHLDVPVSGSSRGGQMSAATRAEAVTPTGDVPGQRRDARAPIVEVAPNTYQVTAADLQELLEQGARRVAEAWPGGWLPVQTRGREPQIIATPVADGTLGPRGFRLTSAKMAEVAGLETGDLVLAVDGHAVNTFADLYQAYRQVRRAARRPRFEVTLERNGVQVTKTYLIQ